MRFRMPMTGALGLIACTAIGLAALKSASCYWSSTLVTMALIAILAAILGSRYGCRRAWHAGFATFGSAYFVLAFSPCSERSCADIC